MSQIYLEIGDLQSLISFLEGAKEIGLLKDISSKKVENLMSKKEFPIRLPIELDQVMAVAANPIVKKMFAKKIEETTLKCLAKAMETE